MKFELVESKLDYGGGYEYFEHLDHYAAGNILRGEYKFTWLHKITLSQYENEYIDAESLKFEVTFYELDYDDIYSSYMDKRNLTIEFLKPKTDVALVNDEVTFINDDTGQTRTEPINPSLELQIIENVGLENVGRLGLVFEGIGEIF